MDKEIAGRSLTLLIFPPFSTNSNGGPYLSPAQLAAYLLERGFRARTFDFAQRFNDWLAGESGLLDGTVSSLASEYRALQTKGAATLEDRSSLVSLVRALASFPAETVESELREYSACTASTPSERSNTAPALSHITAELLWLQYMSVSEMEEHLSEGHALDTMRRFFEFIAAGEVGTALGSTSVVGISVPFMEQMLPSLLLAKLIKEREPQIRVILGGPQITLALDTHLDRLAKLPFVDALVRFEGEVPLARFIEVANERDAWNEVPNLVFCDSNGQIVRTKVTKAAHPNTLPTPVFDDLECYPFRPNSGTALPVLVTQGCYWGKCTFCDYVQLLSPGHPKYTARDPEKVAEDVKELQRSHGVFSFQLSTDSVPPSWAHRFAAEIRKLRISARFWSYLRNERTSILNSDALANWSEAGLANFTCGVESVSDRVLKVVDKGTSVESITGNMYMFDIRDIHATFNMIPDFPTIEREEVLDSMRYIIRHKDVIRDLNPQPFDLSLRTPIGDDPEKFGLRVTEQGVTTGHGTHSARFVRTKGITNEERRELTTPFSLLTEDIGRYRRTVRNRERIASRGFDWSNSLFAFVSSFSIRSAVPVTGRFSGNATYIVLFHREQLVEIPATAKDLLTLLSQSFGSAVSYQAFREAFGTGLTEFYQGWTDDKMDALCRSTLESWVYSGVISHVYGGQCFEPHPTVRAALDLPPLRVRESQTLETLDVKFSSPAVVARIAQRFTAGG